MTSPSKDSPFWRWPGEWFRDKSFWREVASRTLAAVFAAALAFGFAVAGGYVGKPDIRPLVTLAAALATILFGIAFLGSLFALSRRAPGNGAAITFGALFTVSAVALFLAVLTS